MPVEKTRRSPFRPEEFEKQGIKIHTGATVKALKRGQDNVAAQIEAGGKTSALTVERVILAVGIVGNIEEVGLEGTNAKVERTHVVVDEWLCTGESGLYAIGDLVGPPWLAHKAMHEGVICVEHIAGVNDVHPLDTRNIPACTYCRPQIASVGLTEKAARDAGYEVKIGHFPFIGNGKAIALGEARGWSRPCSTARPANCWARMVGAEVTADQGYAIAKTLETTEGELMRTIFPPDDLRGRCTKPCLALWTRRPLLGCGLCPASMIFPRARPAGRRSRHPEKAARPGQPSPRKPPWIRVKAPASPEYQRPAG